MSANCLEHPVLRFIQVVAGDSGMSCRRNTTLERSCYQLKEDQDKILREKVTYCHICLNHKAKKGPPWHQVGPLVMNDSVFTFMCMTDETWQAWSGHKPMMVDAFRNPSCIAVFNSALYPLKDSEPLAECSRPRLVPSTSACRLRMNCSDNQLMPPA